MESDPQQIQKTRNNPYVLSDHNGMKVEGNRERSYRKSLKLWNLNYVIPSLMWSDKNQARNKSSRE